MIKDPFAHLSLSDQEASVLRLAALGNTDREIAQRMAVSEKTVDTYWSRIRLKLEARNRTHAVAIAYREAYEDNHHPLFGCDEMLSDSEEGVWIIDRNGNTVYANRKLAAMFGYSEQEMQKLSGWDLLDENGRSEARKLEDFPMDHKRTLKFRFRRKDGSNLWVLMSATPIRDEGGQPFRCLAMVNEIDPP